MLNISQKQNCNGCTACLAICPQKCITMQEDHEGFLYPKVNLQICNDCGLCTKVCPIINKVKASNNPVAFAAINKNEEIRLQSSSGGIFSLLAEFTIENGGTVFGAAFDRNFILTHKSTNSFEGLSKFRGSKYVQSKIGDTFEEARELLNKGERVLFCGTPCQIEGFISYLNKEYDNLLCLDFICHGVPSPKVFENYKMEIEDRFDAKINNISFRCKNSGWKSYSVSILLDNNSKYEKPYSQDIYMKGYLQNLYLRPSCYACGFKSINRRSDITIADFWGIECLLPEMDDDKGTSLIIVNSSKGQTSFDAINKKLKALPVDIYKAIHYNTSAIASSGYHINRDKFFSSMSFSKTNVSALIHTYTKIKMCKRIYLKLKKMLHKLKCV